MTITKIAIFVESNHPDRLLFYTDLRDPVYPFTDKFSMDGKAAIGTGEDFIKKNFPGIPYKVVKIDSVHIQFGAKDGSHPDNEQGSLEQDQGRTRQTDYQIRP